MIFIIENPKNSKETIVKINSLRSFAVELFYKLDDIGKQMAKEPLIFKVNGRELKFAYYKAGNRYIWVLLLDNKIVPTNPNWRHCDREDIITFEDLIFIKENYYKIAKRLISAIRKIAGRRMKYKAYSNELIEIEIQ